MDIREVDKAYTAGLFDGEGSVGIYCPVGGHHHVQVHLSSTDADILLWLKELFGGYVGSMTRPKDLVRKPAWQWVVSSNGAKEFLQLIRPYSKMKGDQIDVALEFYSLVNVVGRRNILTTVELDARESLAQRLKVLKKGA